MKFLLTCVILLLGVKAKKLKNEKMKNEHFKDLSPKVKMALASLVDDFYNLEKQHTVVVMPFFGLLHTPGNECKPFLNYVDINILDLMQKHFKQVIVYPGENRYLRAYGSNLAAVEHLANEQNILSRIVNKTVSFDGLPERYENIIELYQNAITNFEETKRRFPLPYKTAFDIQTPEELLVFIKQLDCKIKQEDKRNKVCLVCPASYLTDHSESVYNSIRSAIKEVGGSLYFSQNMGDLHLYSASYKLLYDENFQKKFVQSIQDFAKTYNEDVVMLAKEKLDFANIVNTVERLMSHTAEDELVKKIDGVNVKSIYFSNEGKPMKEELTK